MRIKRTSAWRSKQAWARTCRLCKPREILGVNSKYSGKHWRVLNRGEIPIIYFKRKKKRKKIVPAENGSYGAHRASKIRRLVVHVGDNPEKLTL